MKKLFLLMAAGLTVSAANAQQSSSVMLTKDRQMAPGTKAFHGMPTATQHSSNYANKTTGTGTTGCWWSFQMASNNGSIDGGLIPNYPDSTLYVPEGSPPFYWWCHGLGTSFDPTSNYFYNGFLNTSGTVTQPPFKITNGNAYTVDSIEITGFYNRYNTSVAYPDDTLFVDIAAAPATGAYLASFSQSDFSSPINFATDGISNDTTVYLAAPYYDYAANAVSTAHTPGVIHIVKLLDNAAYADSTPNGLHDWIFPISLSVPAGGKVTAYTHFGSGHHYVLGASIDTANYWYSLSYDNELVPLQNSGTGVPADYNMGLVGSTDARYGINYFTVSGNPIPDPSYFYTAPTDVHDPYYNFYITCASCSDVAVANVTKNISANAYPNPAVSEVYIPFTVTVAANVTVSLSNALGQVVKTQTFNQTTSGKAVFNAAELADGVYFYTVKADAQQTNGRIVVAH